MGKTLAEIAVEKTARWFTANQRQTAVIGISGGKDSAVAAAICAKALGPEHVVGVLMPDGEQADIQDSIDLAKSLGIRYMILNIHDSVKGITTSLVPGGYEDEGTHVILTQEAHINIMPRIRMTVLYAVAQSLNEHAVVIGTGNAAEIYVGYTTKWGDSASDFNPLKNLWVHQVINIGAELGVLDKVPHKAPSDGLCGSSDEQRLGFTYDQVYMVATGSGEVPPEIEEKIRARHTMSEHKRAAIPSIYTN